MGNDGFRHFTNLRVYIYITAITYSIYRAISCYYTLILHVHHIIYLHIYHITYRLKTRSVLHPFCDPCNLRAAPMGKSQGLSSRRQAKNSPEKCWNSMHHLGCMKPYETHWNPVNNIKWWDNYYLSTKYQPRFFPSHNLFHLHHSKPQSTTLLVGRWLHLRSAWCSDWATWQISYHLQYLIYSNILESYYCHSHVRNNRLQWHWIGWEYQSSGLRSDWLKESWAATRDTNSEAAGVFVCDTSAKHRFYSISILHGKKSCNLTIPSIFAQDFALVNAGSCWHSRSSSMHIQCQPWSQFAPWSRSRRVRTWETLRLWLEPQPSDRFLNVSSLGELQW